MEETLPENHGSIKKRFVRRNLHGFDVSHKRVYTHNHVNSVQLCIFVGLTIMNNFINMKTESFYTSFIAILFIMKLVFSLEHALCFRCTVL